MVFIIVAVQKGLNQIKSGLKERGYQVVDFGEYNYPIDAIIYIDNLLQFSYITGNNMPVATSGERNNYGVLMVNSHGKTIDEIEAILKTRCYSPLF